MAQKNIKLFALFFISITLVNCSKDKSQTVVNLKNLVWQDEFSVDGTPDLNLWKYDIGTGPNSDGWGNNELEYYTNRPENVKIVDGNLHLIAKKEAYQGKQYTSGRLTTKLLYSQAYGRYEARIKMPWGKGLWPAFWLLGDNIDTVSWPQCGEIDIMEYRGQDPTRIVGSVHGPGYSGSGAISKYYTIPFNRFDNDFHVFGIEWGENYINYYVDDVLYNQITPSDVNGPWVFNHPFYIVLNLAVGGNFLGAPDSQTTFPQEMIVDYVRVYQ